MRKFIIIFVMSVMLFTFTGCINIDNNDINLILDWTPNTNHTGIVVALENGYYSDEGLNVKILQPPEDGAMPLVASGRAQFGISFQESLGIAMASETPLPITAIATILKDNTSGIISVKSRGIEDFSDLEGKNYGAWSPQFESSVINQVMLDSNADFSKVNIVPLGGADALALIRNNIVDAAWVYEGWDVIAAQISEMDYNFIRFTDVSPVFNFYSPIIVANNDYLSQNAEDVRKFLRATARGYKFCVDNPDEAAEILVGNYPEIDIAIAKRSQRFLANEYIDASGVWGYIDNDRWRNFYGWMYDNNIITTNIGDRGYTNEYLPGE